ncbi:hypothetical protein [Marinobacterium sedimentorum]|uniref:hypothetical protein n=1 Tax=Marinobacterium sedimentorum TaxID=2927804 RepID=UPI0020C646A7|nr:hypothetical protein [Marinobacterium sedimentorum]MCP8686732.1 hypothetical protein [Marinobacterium sedimentorum]
MSLSVARVLVARREERPFSSVGELLEVRGLGKDTLHDMRWSVSRWLLRTRTFWTLKTAPVLFEGGTFGLSASRLFGMIELATEATNEEQFEAWAEVNDEEWADLEAWIEELESREEAEGGDDPSDVVPQVDCEECELRAMEIISAARFALVQLQAAIDEVKRLDEVIYEYFRQSGYVESLRRALKEFREERRPVDEDQEYQDFLDQWRAAHRELNDPNTDPARRGELAQKLEELQAKIFDKEHPNRRLSERESRLRFWQKRFNELRHDFCNGPSCRDYSQRYRAQKVRYQTAKEQLAKLKAEYEALLARCALCELPIWGIEAPDFRPNLCDLLCLEYTPSQKYDVGGLEDNVDFVKGLPDLIPPPSDDDPRDTGPEPEPDTFQGWQPPADAAVDCVPCHALFKTEVGDPAFRRQDDLNERGQRYTTELLERYTRFWNQYRPIIDQAIADIRLADAMLRAATCQVIDSLDGGREIRRRRGGGSIGRRAKAARTQALRRISRAGYRLEHINRMLARRQRQLDERTKLLQRAIDRDYAQYLARCEECDPGRPVLLGPRIPLQPETLDVPPMFDGDCNNVASAFDRIPADTDGRAPPPDEDPDAEPPGGADEGASDDAAPVQDKDPHDTPEPLPEEDIGDRIDEILDANPPCQLDRALLQRLRDEIAERVRQRAELKRVTEAEARRLAAVLAAEKARLQVYETQVRRYADRLRELRGQYEQLEDATGTADVRRRHQVSSAYDQAVAAYREAFDLYEAQRQGFNQALDAYNTFWDGPMAAAKDRLKQLWDEIQQRLDRMNHELSRCRQKLAGGPPPDPWVDPDDPPEAVEPETREVVEDLEADNARDTRETEELERTLEGLKQQGPLGQLFHRIVKMDRAIEELDDELRRRLRDLDRRGGTPRDADRDVIVGRLRRRRARLVRRRDVALGEAREAVAGLDEAWWERRNHHVIDVAPQLASLVAAMRRRAQQLKDEGEIGRARALARKADRVEEEGGKRLQEMHDGIGDELLQGLDAHAASNDAAMFVLRRMRERGRRLSELRGRIASRERVLLRMRAASAPEPSDLLEITPANNDSLGDRGAWMLDNLLAARRRPGAYINQRRRAAPLADGAEPADADLSFARIVAAATDLGVPGDTLARMLLVDKSDPVARVRALHRVVDVALDVSGQDADAATDLVLALGDWMRRARNDRSLPIHELRLKGATPEQWRRWIASAKPAEFAGLMQLDPPDEVLDALTDKLEGLASDALDADSAYALARAVLSGFARAAAGQRGGWLNLFEKVLPRVPEQRRPRILTLLDNYEAGFPEAPVRDLGTAAALRRMGSETRWAEFRRLAARAISAARPPDLVPLLDRLRGRDLVGLDGFEGDEATWRSELLDQLVARVHSMDTGDVRPWLPVLNAARSAGDAVPGLTEAIEGRVLAAIGDLAVDDLEGMSLLIDLAIAEGVNGPLGAYEGLDRFDPADVVAVVTERLARRPVGLDTAVLDQLWTHAVNEGMTDPKLQSVVRIGLALPGLMPELLDRLDEVFGGLRHGEDEAKDEAWDFLMGLVRGQVDPLLAARVRAWASQLGPQVMQRNIDHALAGDQPSDAVQEALLVGNAGLVYLVDRVRATADELTSQKVLKLLFEPGGLVLKTPSMSWEDVAEQVYGDRGLGPHLAQLAVGAPVELLPAPTRNDLERRIDDMSYALASPGLQPLSRLDLGGLDTAEREGVRDLRRRWRALTGNYNLRASERWARTQTLLEQTNNVVLAVATRTHGRRLFATTGIEDVDRTLFENLELRIRRVLLSGGDPDLTRELKEYGDFLARDVLPTLGRLATSRRLAGQLVDNPEAREYAGSGAPRDALNQLSGWYRMVREADAAEVALALRAIEADKAGKELTGTRAAGNALWNAVMANDLAAGKRALADLHSAYLEELGVTPERLEQARARADAGLDGDDLRAALRLANQSHQSILYGDARDVAQNLAYAEKAATDFDPQAFHQHLVRKEARDLLEGGVGSILDGSLQAFARRQALAEKLDRLRSLESDLVTPADEEAFRALEKEAEERLAGTRQEASDVLDAIDSGYADRQYLGAPRTQLVRQRLAEAQRALERYKAARRDGRHRHAADWLDTAITLREHAALALHIEQSRDALRKEVKLVEDIFADSYVTAPGTDPEQRHLRRTAVSMERAWTSVLDAIASGRPLGDRRVDVARALRDINPRLLESWAAGVASVVDDYQTESLWKAGAALLLTAITLGAASEVTGPVLILAVHGLRGARIAQVAAMLLVETTIFTGAYMAYDNLLHRRPFGRDSFGSQFVQNLVMLGALKIAGKIGARLSAGLKNRWAQGLVMGSVELMSFASLSFAHQAIQLEAQGRSWRDIDGTKFMLETVGSLLVLKAGVLLGRNLLPERLRAAARQRLGDRAVRIEADIAASDRAIAELNRRRHNLEGSDRAPTPGETQRLLQDQINALRERIRLAEGLKVQGLIGDGQVKALKDGLRDVQRGLDQQGQVVRQLLTEFGIRPTADGLFSFRGERRADLLEWLRNQGLEVIETARDLMVVVNGQALRLRPRVAEALDATPEGLNAWAARLLAEGWLIERLPQEPSTFRLTSAEGEIHTVRVRPADAGPGALALPVRPAAARRPGTVRVARVQIGEGQGIEIRVTAEGESVVTEGELGRLIEQIAVAQLRGDSPDLVTLPEHALRLRFTRETIGEGDVLDSAVVARLQAIADRLGMNLALGVDASGTGSDRPMNGAVILQSGQRATWVSGDAHALSDGAGSVVTINGVRVRFAVCADAGACRPGHSDLVVVLASARQSAVDAWDLPETAVVINSPRASGTGAEAGQPGNRAQVGIDYVDLPNPRRVLATLRALAPEGARPALEGLLRSLKGSSRTGGWRAAERLLAQDRALDWSAFEQASRRGEGPVEQLQALTGGARDITGLETFLQVLSGLPEPLRAQGRAISDRLWRNRADEIARDLMTTPTLAAELLRPGLEGLRDALADRGIDPRNLPQPGERSPLWAALARRLRFGLPPMGQLPQLRPGLRWADFAELGQRVRQAPDSLGQRVRLADIADLVQVLRDQGVDLVEVAAPDRPGARAELELDGAQIRIRLNPHSTWRDLANEIYKRQLLQDLGFDGRLTSEMRAIVEAEAARFEQTFGVQQSERAAFAQRMEGFWRGELERIQSGERPNVLESVEGDRLIIEANDQAMIGRSLRSRISAWARSLLGRRVGTGMFSARFSKAERDTIEEFLNFAQEQHALADQARTRFEQLETERARLANRNDAVAETRKATLDIEIGQARSDRQRAQDEALAATESVLSMLSSAEGSVPFLRGAERKVQLAPERVADLVARYNQINQEAAGHWADYGRLKGQGDTAGAADAQRAALLALQRARRISEALGGRGAVEALERLYGRPSAELWPPQGLDIVSSGLLDRIVRYGRELWVVEEKGGAADIQTAEGPNNISVWQGSEAHTVFTAAKMVTSALKNLKRGDLTDAERQRYAVQLAGGNAVLRAFAQGRLRILVISTPWVRGADGRVTGPGETTAVEGTPQAQHRPSQLEVQEINLQELSNRLKAARLEFQPPE